MQFVSPKILYDKLKNRQDVTLLDVRKRDEFSQWHIYKSINIPLQHLEEEVNYLPHDKEIITISKELSDSKTAAAILSQNGLQTSILKGGLLGWNSVYDFVEIRPKKTSPSTVFQAKRLGKGCISYIVIPADSTKAVIIDPAHHIDIYVDFLTKNSLNLAAVVDTHIHADHISGALELAKKFSIPYLLPEKSEVSFSFQPLERTLPKFLNCTKEDILDTPGHTDESISLVLDELFVFTGDTLLLDVAGRPDLGKEIELNAKLLFESVTQKLFSLDDDLYVLPAHSSQLMVPGLVRAATLRYVKRFNNIGKIRSAQTFINMVSNYILPIPENYIRIKEINKTGISNSNIDFDEIEFSDNYYSTIFTS